MRTRRIIAGVALGVVALAGGLEGATASAPAAGALRVDQLGYAPAEHKVAYLLTTAPVTGAPFSVVDTQGRVVLRGHTGASTGTWNTRFRAVHPLELSKLRKPGTYRVVASLARRVVSPPFRVAGASALFVPRVADAVTFFQAQRDGADVVSGALGRQPAHLRDTTLTIYRPPRYENADSDVILGRSLRRSVGPSIWKAAGWMPATSSSSRTPPPTRRRCCSPQRGLSARARRRHSYPRRGSAFAG